MNNPKEFLQKYIEEYAWSVIPIDENKRPIMTSWKECQEKPLTVDEFMNEVSEGSRKQRITKGVGIVTGLVSFVTVVDFDDGSEDIFNGLRTPTVRTGGGGKHYYFKYTDRISQGSNRELHIDIRNDGGYAILPPSESTKGSYSWILSPDEVEFADLPEDFIKNYQSQVVDHAWDFEGVSDGGRNEASVHVIGSLVKSMERDLSLAWTATLAWNSRNTPPIEEEQLRATFEWCVNKHLKNNPPIVSTSWDDLLVGNIDAVFNEDRVSGIPTHYPFFDQKTGGIRSGVLTLVAGQTGVGKSLILMNFLDKIMAHSDMRITYIDLENGPPEVIERLTRIRFNLEKKFFTDPKNKEVLLKKTKGVFKNFSYFSRYDGLRTLEKLKQVLQDEVEKGSKIIVIDPLQKIDGGNDLKMQGVIVGELSDFAQDKGVAVVLLHHVRKPQTAGGKYEADLDRLTSTTYLNPAIEDVKGAGQITDTAEVVWAVMRKFAENNSDKRTQDLERATTILKVLKCRGGGDAVGIYRFYFDVNTLRLCSNREELSAYTSNLYNDGRWDEL